LNSPHIDSVYPEKTMIARKMVEGKIIVPWDFSRRSIAALNSALEIAGGFSQIRVIHVAAPLAGPDNGALYDSAEKHKTRELEKRFHKQIGDEERFRKIQFCVKYGYRAQEIVRFAESHRAVLIVMTSRARKGLSRLVFGRLAERVERLAKCPVLNVQGESPGHLLKNTRRDSSNTWLKPQGAPAVSYHQGRQ
jgi:nucleotide-binding universal stress UspA family protein